MRNLPGEHGSSGKAGVSIRKLLTGVDRRKLQNDDLVVNLVLRSGQRVEELLELVFNEEEIVGCGPATS